MTFIAPLVTSFLREHLPIERGCSPHTCEAYAHALRLLFIFTSKRLGIRPSEICLEQIDATLILNFLAEIEEQRSNCPATRNGRLAAIKAFMRFVEFRVPSALAQVRQIHGITAKRHDQNLIRHLTREEVRAILNVPDVTTRLGIRDRAMLHLCFAAALRVSELVGLPLENLSLQPSASIRVLGKGRKQRCLPLWKETAADLRRWLTVRGAMHVPELFVNAEGMAMTRAGFEYILNKHVSQAAKTCSSLTGRSVSPHQLRHSCALTVLQATKDIRKVALWLGHADIRTTEVYLRVDPSEKLEAVEAVLPVGLRRGRFKMPDALIASLFEPGFEREIISERTRDKMSAARRKGKWIGGHPVLGYDIDTKGGRIIVNPAEAEQVRTIFDLYIAKGSTLPALQEAQRIGLVTKRWTTEDGSARGGMPFTRGSLHAVLTSVLYTGMVDHKGVLPG